MPRNGEDKAGKEHAQRNDNRSREGIAKGAIDQPALESDESCKNDQWRWQHVSDGNAIQEDVLREPATSQNGFDLNKRNGCIGASEGQTAGNQTQKEEIDE